jgi:hypothetical protein
MRGRSQDLCGDTHNGIVLIRANITTPPITIPMISPRGIDSSMWDHASEAGIRQFNKKFKYRPIGPIGPMGMLWRVWDKGRGVTFGSLGCICIGTAVHSDINEFPFSFNTRLTKIQTADWGGFEGGTLGPHLPRPLPQKPKISQDISGQENLYCSDRNR